MTDLSPEDAEHDPIFAAAAEWFTRMRDRDLSIEVTMQWQHWMSADRRHAAAFQGLEETWQVLGDTPRPRLLSSDKLAADSYDGRVAVSDHREASRGRGAIAKRRMALAAGVALVAIGCAAVLGYGGFPGAARLHAQVIETAIGQHDEVVLADGSRVVLGAHTRLEVRFSPQHRELTLASGEAFFKVAKDAARPFAVRAGNAVVTAVGTEFNISRAGDRTVVAVVEGRVLLQPDTSLLQWVSFGNAREKEQTRPLDGGHRSMIDGAGVESTAALPDPQSAVAWQKGRLAFQREPLRYVLDNVNRYSRKPLVLADAATGELQFTGTVMSDNLEGWVASLAPALGIEAVEEPGRIVLQRK